ncbi:hypothetical protein F5Y10DRAFT_243355 [Nemania abortiva]|nr:hypothetical protein F5Y10DRAFT_243355 [Nemania abortiva]
MRTKQATARWTVQRQSLILGVGGEKVYEARVDGVLRSRGGEVKAIVEVKPCTRSSKPKEIRWQEAAQMAAWICSHPPSAGELLEMREKNKKARRLLVSQDMCEIYLTLAEFDADYVDYVCGKDTEIQSFLRMNEYGPFDTRLSKQMKALGHLLLAFTINESLRV